MAAPTTGSPYTAVPSSMLCQDYISSDSVTVDPVAGQVAPFCNPAKASLAEAFVIVTPEGESAQVQYLAQDSTQPNGWSLVDIPAWDGGTPTAVVAAVNAAGQTGGINLFWIDGSQLWQTWQTGEGTWQSPSPVASVALTTLAVTYTLFSSEDVLPKGNFVPVQSPSYQPIVYGVTTPSGTQDPQLLMLAWYNGGWWPFTATISGASPGAAVVLTCFQENSQPTNISWVLTTLAAGSTATPAFWSGTFSIPESWPPGAPVDTTASGPNTSNYESTRSDADAQTIFGCAALNDTRPPQVWPFYLSTSDMPYMCTSYANYWDQILPSPSQNVSVATTTLNANGMLSVFLVDQDTDVLSLLRQVGVGNSGTMPLWAPYISISPDVEYVYPDTFPGDPLLCFVAGAASEGGLTLVQNVAGEPPAPGWTPGTTTGAPVPPKWLPTPVTLGTTIDVEVSRYRTQITLYDVNGTTVPNYPLSLTATAACGVQVGAQSFVVGPLGIVWPAEVTVGTDATGALTLATLATDLAPPTITITDQAGNLPGEVVVSPGGQVQYYLGGSADGGLGPTTTAGYDGPQQFGSGTLTSNVTVTTPPTNNGRGGQTVPVFPGATSSNSAQAAQGIGQTIAMPSTPIGTAPSFPPTGGAPPGPEAAGPQVVGFIIDNTGLDGPIFQSFTSRADLHAELLRQGRYVQFNVFHDISDAFDDVWSGITSFATSVAHIAVDLEQHVVSIVVKIGDVLEEIGSIIVETIEDACRIVLAILSVLETAFEILLLFLKALFDFGAIWRTMMAFDQAIAGPDLSLPNFLTDLLATVNDKVLADFNAVQGAITGFFASLESALGDNTFGDAAAQGGQSIGSPPTSTPLPNTNPPSGAPVSAAGVTANPQSNWLQAQVSASGGTAPALPTDLGQTLDQEMSALISLIEQDVTGAWSSFVAALKDLAGSVKDLVDAKGQSAEALAELSLAEFLQTINDVIDALLDLANLLIDALLDLANTAVQELNGWLNKELELGFINTLFDLLGKLAGYPPGKDGNPTFTVSTFISLLLAFPYTIGYWLVQGMKSEPFPDGLPAPGPLAPIPGAAEGEQPGANVACQLAGPMMQMLYTFVDWTADVVDETPGWLEALEVVGPMLITTFTWPSPTGIPFSPDASGNSLASFSGTSAENLEAAAWSMGYTYPVISMIFYGLTKMAEDEDKANSFTLLGQILYSAFGFTNICFAIAGGASKFIDSDPDVSVEEIIADLIAPIGNAFAFLTSKPVKDLGEEVFLIAKAVKLLLDFVSDCVGGAAGVIGVMVDEDS
ncbi:MAG: hypothetical protein QOI56_126 [Actinomycetota bacterium]|nr:hypothetical protein [Actinomycetota bacterium]